MKTANRKKIVSLILKVIVIASAVTGVVMTAASGRNSFMGGNRVFMYFTIQSNILIALIAAVGIIFLFREKPAPRAWQIIQLVGTVSITLTGLVFCFVLVPVLGNGFWNFQNILTHVVVPIVSVLDFFVSGTAGVIRIGETVYVTIPPLLYAIYAGIGYIKGWEFSKGVNYPYFFLNWGSPAGVFGFTEGPPFMGTGWWILAILILLMALGILYLGVLQLISRVFKQTEP